MATAVLAVQGAFAEHEARLAELGETCVELRQASDLRQRFDRLVLPGGESTTQGKLLAELGMLEPLRERIEDGMPVLATCAGLILLARHLDAHDDRDTPRIATLDVLVRRNAYGRQLGSFRTSLELAGMGSVPATFIRAPFVMETGRGRGDVGHLRRKRRGRAAGQTARPRLPSRARRGPAHPPALPRPVAANPIRKPREATPIPWREQRSRRRSALHVVL